MKKFFEIENASTCQSVLNVLAQKGIGIPLNIRNNVETIDFGLGDDGKYEMVVWYDYWCKKIIRLPDYYLSLLGHSARLVFDFPEERVYVEIDYYVSSKINVY